MCTPMQLKPCSLRINAAAVESMPPDMATATTLPVVLSAREDIKELAQAAIVPLYSLGVECSFCEL